MSWIFPRIVQVQGPITPGHCVTWIDENTIGDSGAPCGGGPPTYTPSLDFSDLRNSQYIPTLGGFF